MKKIKPIIILLLLAEILYAQKGSPKVISKYALVDKKALEMPDSLTMNTVDIAKYVTSNFTSNTDKSRAIFIWIAKNIQYDISNMFAINFYEKKEEKISKPLLTRKGICENYAALFNDICLKTGIQSYVVEGYTKQNGFTDYIPHAWCAALIDSAWFMFDPTWGSGYVKNGKFYMKIDENYFKVQPTTLIKSHMPFDYLWQFLNYPVNNQEFYEGKRGINKSKPFFSYVDSIKLYENQSYIEQLATSSYRIERNGVKNSMIFDRLRHIKLEIEGYNQKQVVDSYNKASVDLNFGINYLNEFIDYRNKQFTPLKSDPEIQDMIDKSGKKIYSAKSELEEIKNPDANISTMMAQLNKSIEGALKQVEEQQDWLKTYFKKGPTGRKNAFYKFTIIK